MMSIIQEYRRIGIGRRLVNKFPTFPKIVSFDMWFQDEFYTMLASVIQIIAS